MKTPYTVLSWIILFVKRLFTFAEHYIVFAFISKVNIFVADTSKTGTIQFDRCDLFWSILLFNEIESEQFVHLRTKFIRSNNNNNFSVQI